MVELLLNQIQIDLVNWEIAAFLVASMILASPISRFAGRTEVAAHANIRKAARDAKHGRNGLSIAASWCGQMTALINLVHGRLNAGAQVERVPCLAGFAQPTPSAVGRVSVFQQFERLEKQLKEQDAAAGMVRQLQRDARRHLDVADYGLLGVRGDLAGILQASEIEEPVFNGVKDGASYRQLPRCRFTGNRARYRGTVRFVEQAKRHGAVTAHAA